MDGRTDGRTKLLIELLCATKNPENKETKIDKLRKEKEERRAIYPKARESPLFLKEKWLKTTNSISSFSPIPFAPLLNPLQLKTISYRSIAVIPELAPRQMRFTQASQ